jgi:hypothetical protein
MLEASEIGRLAVTLQLSGTYIERRFEELHLAEDRFVRVSVRQQILVPLHGPTQDAVDAYIPLGWYSKARLPDLLARDGDGAELALPTRSERAVILGTIASIGWTVTYQQPTPFGNAVGGDSLLAWRFIQSAIGFIATQDEETSLSALHDLRQQLRDWAQAAGQLDRVAQYRIGRLHYSTEFWEQIESLVETTLLVAIASVVPGSQMNVSVAYAERIEPARWGHQPITWLMQVLGFIPTPVIRNTGNLGKTQTLYVSARMPAGVEAVRFYWEREARRRHQWSEGQISSENPTIMGQFDDVQQTHVRPPASRTQAHLEAQIEPSDTIGASILIAGFVLAVSTFIYQQAGTISSGDRTDLVTLAGVFSGVPALLSGAIAYRGVPFARRVIRAPRYLLTGISILSAALAVVVTLRQVSVEMTRSIAFVTSVFCFLTVGILAYVQFGVRCRLTSRTRWLRWVSRYSPVRCRRVQERCALVYGVALALVTVAFGRAQWALRTAHFVTHHFPENVFHALATWL